MPNKRTRHRGARNQERALPVDSIRHKDKRANIPTEELRDFVAEDEQAPPVMRYPRDPSLDPQLVWKGKDEQDAADLAVPVVPVYIQEKIHPQALIEDLRREQQARAASEPEAAARGTARAEQLNLFADFNGVGEDFERKVDFYSHDAGSQPHWSNRMILGDSLLVMTSLAEKEGLKGKVQMIYLDPPYGIKFGSNWQVSTRKRDVKDGKVEDATRQPEQIRAFRDTWKLGIHSYLKPIPEPWGTGLQAGLFPGLGRLWDRFLAYLRDRLVAARDLLTETGSIFVQIGDENLHLVRCVLDEVFGSENFYSLILFKKTGGLKSRGLASVGDYLLWYAKDIEHVKYQRIYREKKPGTSGATQFKYIIRKDGTLEELKPQQLLAADPDDLISHDNLTSQGNAVYEYTFKGTRYSGAYKPPPTSMDRLAVAGRILALGRTLRYVRRLTDFEYVELNELWDDLSISGFADEKVYVVQTLTDVVERCLLMTTDPGDLVLDPTCGSGTTAHVAEQWGRRWITIDTSRVALALARTRLMAAKYPYYLLADSPEGIGKEAELTGQRPPAYQTASDIKRGFVYRRVPHVTLKSIANNPDIREGLSRAEIDAAIARHAETEVLYDQPYPDPRRVRVSGPFTVESLSPHRVLPADENMDGTVTAQERSRQQDFATMILDNLRKAGVQNTKKAERLVFETLEPFAGTWIHATGTYLEGGSGVSPEKDTGKMPVPPKLRRVAVSIGPEHGTVGPQLVKEAAKEAVQGVGFDVLIVCGFTFDPHVTEEAKRYGKLTVLACRMNPDLAMGDELLKKTGAGNLFMIFGEPDVEIQRVRTEPRPSGSGAGKPLADARGSDQIVVKIKGVDVYDPTTGAIRSAATDDIACWFIDTNYDGESFFVRHAYFTGSDEPYEKLKRALRAEIDEAPWAALSSTKSRSFDKPETGKIAIKVINHYGDEVLKVFTV